MRNSGRPEGDASAVSEEWLCTQILRGLQDAVVFADRAGCITYWNAGAEAMFGYAADEAVGQNLDLIIPDRLRTRHNKAYERVMDTGETKYGTELLKVPALRKDGSTISIEFRVVLVGGPPPVGVAAVIREVTAEWDE